MKTTEETPPTEWLLVYDKQCPVCDYYCNALDAARKGAVRLVDARTNPVELREITARGIDIDQNMVLKRGDRLYVGADAVHQLALAGAPSSLFNRVNIGLFRSRRHARWIYPALRFGRNLLLKLLRRRKINNLDRPNNRRF